MIEQKNLKIAGEVHQKLKVLAAKRKTTIYEIVNKLLKDALQWSRWHFDIPHDVFYALRMTSMHNKQDIDKVILSILKQYYDSRNKD